MTWPNMVKHVLMVNVLAFPFNKHAAQKYNI